MKTKNIIRLAIGTILLLLIPLLAMQFTDEVRWGLFDFIFMGILLFGSGLAYEFIVTRQGSTVAYRAATFIAVGTALALVWINGRRRHHRGARQSR